MQASTHPLLSTGAPDNPSAPSLTTRLSGVYDQIASPEAKEAVDLDGLDLSEILEGTRGSSSQVDSSLGAPQSPEQDTSLNKGPWSREEDDLLRLFVQVSC